MARAPPMNLHPQSYAHIEASLDDTHFKTMFGFSNAMFIHIHDALRLPEPVRTKARDVIDSKTVLLMRLAWLRGSRLRALEGQFGWSHGRSSRIVHHLSEFLYKRWGHLLDATSDRHRLLEPRRLDELAAAIERRTGFPTFWGSVDGTVRPIAMPDQQQEEAFNGHKRHHAIKFQFISTPDGLIFCSVPFEGRRHDSHLVAGTGLVEWASRSAKGADGEQRYLYGDQAYGNSHAIISPFRGNFISSTQERFNRTMSKYRVTVEWSIGMISMQWPRFRDKQYQRTGLTRTCLVGNMISGVMGIRPPEITQYFGSRRVARLSCSPDPGLDQTGVNDEELAELDEQLDVEEAIGLQA